MPAPRQINTEAIVLRRVNYGEADRITTLLTPDHGKLSAIAKGVRKPKSKLAGGLELFSVSEISFIKGKKDIDTLTSTRLKQHFGGIVKDLDRTTIGYELIGKVNKVTEEHPEAGYFNLLIKALEALDDKAVDPNLTELWFNAQLLKLAGHSPNLQTTSSNQALSKGSAYNFNLDSMAFEPGQKFKANNIKFLRLLFSHNSPTILQKIDGVEALVKATSPTIAAILGIYLPG